VGTNGATDPLPELPRPEAALPPGAAVRFEDGALWLTLATEIYSVAAILRSCYWLTDKCYVHLYPAADSHVEVTILAKSGEPSETSAIAWDLLNGLIDNQLRVSIQQETTAVREMIVAQAFSDVDVIDDRGRTVREGGVPSIDQQAITNWRPVP
jgi:His-Xaa-Ser system protein HxsD